MNILLKAALAGLFFGLWPLAMNRSGLSGNVSSVAFSVATLIGVLPFALYSNGGLSIPSANWTMVGIAGVLGAIGLLNFNGMLAEATPLNVGSLFIVMVVVQVTVPALYQMWMDGRITAAKGFGFMFAAIGVYLLMKK